VYTPRAYHILTADLESATIDARNDLERLLPFGCAITANLRQVLYSCHLSRAVPSSSVILASMTAVGFHSSGIIGEDTILLFGRCIPASDKSLYEASWGLLFHGSVALGRNGARSGSRN